MSQGRLLSSRRSGVTCDDGVFQMSDRDLTRLRVMIDLADDRLTVEPTERP
jgi:hypothetical protein